MYAFLSLVTVFFSSCSMIVGELKVDLFKYQVLQLLLSIEDTPLSITTSRKVILLISRIQMGLSGARIAGIYMPSVLYGVIGIFHNRFSYLWDPASDCIAVLIGKYFDMTWDIFVQYLEQCESNFLASHDQSERSRSAPTSKSSGTSYVASLLVALSTKSFYIHACD